MASIEQAINALFDPLQPEHIKKSAMDLIDLAKQDPEFYKFAIQKITELNLEVPNSLYHLFWYIQSLEEIISRNYTLYPQTMHLEIQAFLFMVIESRIDIIQKHYGILNKFSVLYVRVMQVDFPTAWPQAFQLLIDRAQKSIDYANLFLSVLKVFSEEIDDELENPDQQEVKRSSELRDAICDTVLLGTAEIWKTNLEGDNQALAKATLQVIKSFIPWIPLEISISFTPYFIKYLNIETTQISVLQCIDKICNKKIDIKTKFEIIQNLKIIPFIKTFSYESFNMLSDTPDAMCTLVYSLAENLLDMSLGQEFYATLEDALKILILSQNSNLVN